MLSSRRIGLLEIQVFCADLCIMSQATVIICVAFLQGWEYSRYSVSKHAIECLFSSKTLKKTSGFLVFYC